MTQIQNKVALFAENVQSIRKEFKWHNDMTARLAALLYVQEGQQSDCESIRHCHGLIKQNTGTFSAFRGDMSLCIATMLSLSQEPQKLFEETLTVYNMLKNEKFRSSDYLRIAAVTIAKQTAPDNYSHVIKRAKDFYSGMKYDHSILTREDDYIFAAMLGMSDLNVEKSCDQMEVIYTLLKKEFSDKNSIQSLAQILVISGSDETAVRHILELRDAFKSAKINLHKSYSLPVLGIFSLLNVPTEVLVNEVGVAVSMLREQKGFGKLSVGTEEILLYASALTTGKYLENNDDNALFGAISTSISSIIISMEIAVMVVLMASVIAATSSSSS